MHPYRNPAPRTVWAPDYPWGWGPDDVVATGSLKQWGTVEYGRAY